MFRLWGLFAFGFLFYSIFFVLSLFPMKSGSVEVSGAEAVVRLEIPSSFNIVGSGARAMGMGGAFIATADDATAASWNPGGLIQLENPEFSIVYTYSGRAENKHYSEGLQQSGKDKTDDLGLNYLSLAWPFEINTRNMVISINYQHLYDFNHKWTYQSVMPSGTAFYHYEQQGNLYALGLAFCSEVFSHFSIGTTLNLWDNFFNENGWEQKYVTTFQLNLGGAEYISENIRIEDWTFKGINANVGFLWEVTPAWRMGGVLKTPFDADINYHLWDEKLYQADLTLRMPLSFGFGVSWRPSDLFIISGDIFWTQWKKFYLKNSRGNKISPISGKAIQNANVKNTAWLRLGMEYLFVAEKYIFPFRVGFFYDPAPAEGTPEKYYGVCLGTGMTHKQFAFDVAYQFRWGNQVAASMPDFSDFHDVREHKIYTSWIFYF